MCHISHFLEHRLKPTVNTTKSRVVRINESKFLDSPSMDLGRVDADALAPQRQPVSPWLDQLLWHRYRLPTLLRSRSLDPHWY